MIDSEILPAAEVEYNQAIDWYLEKSVSAANRFAAEVETAIETIRARPEQFSRWDDRYRFYLLNKFPYFVAYRNTSTLVVIVAIRRTS